MKFVFLGQSSDNKDFALLFYLEILISINLGETIKNVLHLLNLYTIYLNA